MYLPGRLAASTLGDLLGALYRRRVSGVVELAEVGGGPGVPGRLHRISLADGLVADVETPIPGGDVRARLDALYALDDASVRFHVAPKRAARARLDPREFLHGRPRARDGKRTRASAARPAARVDDDAAARATLGLTAGASEAEIRRAFRRIAKELHPDRSTLTGAAAEAQRARFVAVVAAYQRLKT